MHWRLIRRKEQVFLIITNLFYVPVITMAIAWITENEAWETATEYIFYTWLIAMLACATFSFVSSLTREQVSLWFEGKNPSETWREWLHHRRLRLGYWEPQRGIFGCISDKYLEPLVGQPPKGSRQWPVQKGYTIHSNTIIHFVTAGDFGYKD